MLYKKIVISLLLVLSLKANDNDILTTILNQSVSGVKEILKEASIQKRYERDRTLLHYAVEINDFNSVSFLVRKKIILSSQGGAYNNTALQDAIFYGYLKIAHYLIKKGTPLNIKNRYGQTALDIASSREYKDVIELLLTYGAEQLTLDDNENIPHKLVRSTKRVKKKLKSKDNYTNIVVIDKKSKIHNSYIGIQINTKE